ncbi:MAG: glycosyltransferase [Candidatus Eremiobacteraeota bacterium]|nr:glycosyltransferase [Candidatus Eremiobacteraeota bacterium]
MERPTVSVVIKAYNHEKYVAQSIDSILTQSFQDFELVVTDDGSTDATPEIIRSFTDPRVDFVRFERNRGISQAMNATVARARGEFVAILNSDDFALPGRLETQVAFLREHPDVAAVFSVPRQVGEDGEPVAGLGALFDFPFDEPNPPRRAWLRRFFFRGNSLCAPSAMVRRAVLNEIGPDDPRLTNLQDFDRWIRLLEKHEIFVATEALTAFRVRANHANASGANHAATLRAAFEFFEVYKRYRAFAPPFLREIFAEDVLRNGIDASGPSGTWLAELALLGETPWHHLFALDTLYEAASDDASYRRLRDLAASVNPFRIPNPA